jgi:hypothetical protein
MHSGSQCDACVILVVVASRLQLQLKLCKRLIDAADLKIARGQGLRLNPAIWFMKSRS